MGIYDAKKAFAFGFEAKKARYIAIAVIGIVIVFLAIMFISAFFSREPIQADFSENPLFLREKPFTLLEVRINNVIGEQAENVKVTVSARDRHSIFVGPGFEDSKTIPTIESGQYRKIYFLIFPQKGISEGSYIITINTEMNSHYFEKELALIVKPD